MTEVAKGLLVIGGEHYPFSRNEIYTMIGMDGEEIKCTFESSSTGYYALAGRTIVLVKIR